MQGSVLCHTEKDLHNVAEFYTLPLLGGGRFFQRDSPSPPPRRLHRAFLSAGIINQLVSWIAHQPSQFLLITYYQLLRLRLLLPISLLLLVPLNIHDQAGV